VIPRERDIRTFVGNAAMDAAPPATRSLPRSPQWLRSQAVAAGYAVAFLAAALLLAVTLPSAAGFHTVTVYGGSMGESLPEGSVAVLRPVDAAELHVGDVIAMGRRDAGLPILHRIVTIEDVDGGRLITTRGDANQTNDPLPMTVSGKGDRLAYHVRWLGYLLAFARSPLGLALLVGIPAGLWAIREASTMARALKRRRRRPRASSLSGG
jgi:signal peptidase